MPVIDDILVKGELQKRAMQVDVYQDFHMCPHELQCCMS